MPGRLCICSLDGVHVASPAVPHWLSPHPFQGEFQALHKLASWASLYLRNGLVCMVDSVDPIWRFARMESVPEKSYQVSGYLCGVEVLSGEKIAAV